jgi:hypothetical protein
MASRLNASEFVNSTLLFHRSPNFGEKSRQDESEILILSSRDICWCKPIHFGWCRNEREHWFRLRSRA